MSCLDSVENNDKDSRHEIITERLYAHSRKILPSSNGKHLINTLWNVGSITREFADDFRSGLWGEILGRLHDVGKARLFSAYLKRCNGIEDGRMLAPLIPFWRRSLLCYL